MLARRISGVVVCALLLTSRAALAQHDMSMHTMSGPLPTSSGQAAFATISEVVRILKADSSTDWSKVNIEALRQHLIDMDAVTMRSTVRQHNVDGGMEADVTGTGPTAAAIKRMLTMHAAMLDQSAEYHATSVEIPNGVRFRVTARESGDARAVAQIRGLGFAGLLTEGDHHPRHHMALARGR
jgi:predicted transcriptional regulator